MWAGGLPVGGSAPLLCLRSHQMFLVKSWRFFRNNPTHTISHKMFFHLLTCSFSFLHIYIWFTGVTKMAVTYHFCFVLFEPFCFCFGVCLKTICSFLMHKCIGPFLVTNQFFLRQGDEEGGIALNGMPPSILTLPWKITIKR